MLIRGRLGYGLLGWQNSFFPRWKGKEVIFFLPVGLIIWGKSRLPAADRWEMTLPLTSGLKKSVSSFHSFFIPCHGRAKQPYN